MGNYFEGKGGRSYHYVRNHLDELSIVTVLVAIGTATDDYVLSEQDHVVLAALKRANHALSDSSVEEVQTYLSGLSDKQIPGLVSNVKGIVHEMEFIRLENEDGDSVYASLFQNSNHPDTDVMFIDEASGESWEVQLKATDSAAYVQEWIDAHPEGEIVVTDELALEMDLPGSGQSNEQLTSSVSDFIDKMIEEGGDSDLWGYFPALSVLSVSCIVLELWQRYQRGDIEFEQFKRLVALATGLKVTKVAALMFLLSLPVIGQVTGAVLIANLLLSAKATWFNRPPVYIPPAMLPVE